MSVKTDPLGLRGRQVPVSRCSDGLTLSLKSFIDDDRGYITEFDIIMKGV